MIRLARPQDTDAIWAFLNPRRATSMFLSGNLLDHGINTAGHPKANTVWLSWDRDQIQAVFALTEYGYFVFEIASFDLQQGAELRRALGGRTLRGINGCHAPFVKIRKALGLAAEPAVFDDCKPHYLLDLKQLQMPSGDSVLRPMRVADLAVLQPWFASYSAQVLGLRETPENRALSDERLTLLIDSGRGRVLWLGGQPVAMTAFNAVAGSCVQVGSVYTPSHLRGQGHARRAVALHLDEARQQGVQEAILFAATPAAAHAYEAIGFRRIGDYGIVDFASPIVLPAKPEVAA
ncbi:GNAT family N-acetyltransferase [Rhodobacteraceae bacterium M382]|nr:GNAT family N-acetyltransferase [Rhodobacteraceae bacterium M382]